MEATLRRLAGGWQSHPGEKDPQIFINDKE
jgi:hypothetical protein